MKSFISHICAVCVGCGCCAVRLIANRDMSTHYRADRPFLSLLGVNSNTGRDIRMATTPRTRSRDSNGWLQQHTVTA